MADAALLARVVNHVVNEESAMGAIRPHRYGFQVDTRIDGKRRRRVLHTREEAEATLALWEGSPRGSSPMAAASEEPDPAPPAACAVRYEDGRYRRLPAGGAGSGRPRGVQRGPNHADSVYA